MKKLQLALIALVAMAPALCVEAIARTRAYLQLSPLYAIPAKDLEVRSGVGLSLGAAVDERHEIELEGTAFNTELKPHNTSWHTEESDIRFRHLLATYRFNLFAGKSHRLFVGLSAGAARVAYDVKTIDQNITLYTVAVNTPSTGVSATMYDSRYFGSQTPYSVLPAYTYNPADQTLTTRYSGSNTVATSGPQIGFSYKVTPNSHLSLLVKGLYMGKTDITKAGWMTFVQSGFRYTF